ncbi:MAG: 4Fe-4S binding protein [Clostridia bacterium]|nr:4Fe-4S binding protein [Clostridia bacterium]
MNKIIFETEMCKGCGLCAVACPKGIISLDDSVLNGKGYHPAHVTDMSLCIACASCAVMCPDAVITVIKEQEAK